MTCPKCGNTIYQGDILCGKCNYPVAMMSGGVARENNVVQPIVKQVEVQEQYINPTKEQASSMMPPPPPKVQQLKSTNSNKYSNYGEGKQAITSLKFIIPIIIGIIVLIFVVYGIFSFVKSFILDKEEQKLQEQITAYQIEFNNFLYELPGDLTYQKETNKKTLYISDSDFTWEMSIQVIDSTYSSTRSRKASIKSYFQSLGYQVSEVIEAKYGLATYLILEAKKDKKNYLLAVTKAGDSSKCFGLSIHTKTNELNYNYLEEVSDILVNAKYQKTNNTSENKVDFDFNNALK